MAAERLRSLVTTVVVAAPFAVGWGVGAGDETPPQGLEVTTWVDPEIVESSGLVATGDRLLTTNDSGDEGRVFVVDPGTGRTVGVTRWADDPTDVEALAPAGEDAVWVADIGDNWARRSSLALTRVPVADTDQAVSLPPMTLTYPGPPRDAEALVAHPVTGRLFVLTKGTLGGEAWAVPAGARPGSSYQLRSVGRVPGMVTDAAFLPDGRHVVARSYARAFVLALPSWQVVASWPLPEQPQGEGLAVTPEGDLLLSSEGAGEPVLRVPLPAEARRAVAGVGPREEAGPSVVPRADDVPPDPAGSTGRDAGQWWLGGLVAVVMMVVLARAVRPPR